MMKSGTQLAQKWVYDRVDTPKVFYGGSDSTILFVPGLDLF